VIAMQNMIQQRGLARAEKACQNGDGYGFHVFSFFSLPRRVTKEHKGFNLFLCDPHLHCTKRSAVQVLSPLWLKKRLLSSRVHGLLSRSRRCAAWASERMGGRRR
jgi:hypothetical protein